MKGAVCAYRKRGQSSTIAINGTTFFFHFRSRDLLGNLRNVSRSAHNNNTSAKS